MKGPVARRGNRAKVSQSVIVETTMISARNRLLNGAQLLVVDFETRSLVDLKKTGHAITPRIRRRT
jgi:hypothetical protein